MEGWICRRVLIAFEAVIWGEALDALILHQFRRLNPREHRSHKFGIVAVDASVCKLSWLWYGGCE